MIASSIRAHGCLIVVCSERSLGSIPVLVEISKALHIQDKKGRRILFPVAIDDYLFEKLREPHIPEFLDLVVGDFRNATRTGSTFDDQIQCVLRALRKDI